MEAAPNNWRLRPSAAAAHQIRQIALKEGRSLTNTLTKLVTEALDARRIAQARTEDIERLVAAMKKPADAEPAGP